LQRGHMNTDEQYMELAIEEAYAAKQVGELPIGAVIRRKGKVIARNRCREAAEKTVLAHAKIPRIVIGAARSDLPHLLRDRKFRIEHLAEDSGYGPEIIRGVLKEKVLGLFAGIRKR
jgi:tRNA(Arg) A34 adenosine deaminase TadA